MTDVAGKLREARALIERGWCQEVFATFNDGQPRCFCATGAISQVIGGDVYAEEWAGDEEFDAALSLLAKTVDVEPRWASVADWNDAKGRTQAEVLAAFDRAIEHAEQSHD